MQVSILTFFIEQWQPICLFTGSLYLTYYLGKYHRHTIETIQKEIQKETKTIYETEKEKFYALYEEQNETHVNSNIHPDLYCYEKLQELMKTEENEQEKKWKSRILFFTCPQGNMIMYYDLYKQAFSYFSDTAMSYLSLNTCAMRYVRVFSCRDFFTDTDVLPDHIKNPYNEMKLDEMQKEKEKKKKKKEELKVNFDADVFVKKTKKNGGQKLPGQSIVKPPSVNRFINHFCHMGKMQNYNVLQKVSFPNKRMSNKTLHICHEQDDTEIISKDYQYIEFKQKNKSSKAFFDFSFLDTP